ncbi:hypothetical protein D187_007012 [Cystobacter fuscus DSM 2262]|uniref:Uncharacterized protein n=1 Tax=Cystobacter fuscus (strain ATCC 25194 / DSM 2262 / NBRC 100088 / M29) TaxID=1242864 RepID=S9QLA0_CYSF2|nr:hypothetical protein [Cystobacter fuscus]EPX57258.1 hypothetical protein D187_007012 [Cystobacter fuscus DSM 2262]
MLCLTCAEPRIEAPESTCPVCGASLQPLTSDSLESLVQERLQRKISALRATRLIDEPTATRLSDALVGATAVSVAAPLLEEPPTLEQKADALADKLAALEDWRPTWGRSFFQSLEDRAREEREARQQALRRERRAHDHEDGLDLASDSGQALFHRVDAGALGGLEAMAALDGDTADTSDSAPKLHEYVWWFLGAVLVLGGSLMGVREAWRALGGVPRQLLVTGALFAYHAAFIGLGVFLSRRSASVGRVLASIGIALLPVVYVALSSLVALEPLLGGAVAAGLTGLCLVTLRPTARLLYGASPVSLGGALIPSLLAGLPLMALDEAPGARTLCAFVGVAALAGSVWRVRKEAASRAALAVLSTGLYGAAALALFTVASAPEGFAALSPGNPLLSGMTLWGMALATVVAGAAIQPRAHELHPRTAPVVETIAYAVVACGALASATVALGLSPGVTPNVDLASALSPLAASLAFFVIGSARPALVHPGVLSLALASVLLARLGIPGVPQAWMVGLAVVGAGLLPVARVSESSRLRSRLLGWGVVLSVASLALTSFDVLGEGLDDPRPSIMAGALVALSAHLTGGFRWRGLHYLGGLGALVSGLALVDMLGVPGPAPALGLLGVMAALYAGAGLLQDAWLRRAGKTDEFLPLDDLSLVVAALGALRSTVLLDMGANWFPPHAPLTMDALQDVVLGCAPALFLSGLLLLRARRDRSRLVSALAAWALATAVWLPLFHFVPVGMLLDVRALHLAGVALGFSLIASPRHGEASSREPRPKARRLIGWFRLPFPESGRALYTDGFASVALMGSVFSLLLLTTWMVSPTEQGRPNVVLAGALLVAGAALAFLSRGFVTWRLRGSVGTLAAVGLFIALTAVLNRLGRPLPPDVVALKLTCIGGGLWLLALATRRFGPALGLLLENERHGPLYQYVPFAGVAVLGLVLAGNPLHMGGPVLTRALTVVPPLFPLGAALLALLLATAFESRPLVKAALLLGLPGAALWAVQGTPLGHALVAMDPPGGRWIRADTLELTRDLSWLARGAWLKSGETIASVWYRAFGGIAAAGFVYAGVGQVLTGVEARHRFLPSLANLFQRWAGIAAGLVFVAAFFQPGLEAAVLTLGAGLLLLSASRARALGRLVCAGGLLLLVHALAHREPRFAVWPGPVLAFVGLLAVFLSPHVARWRKHNPERSRVQAQLGALFYGVHALLYALATGGSPKPEVAMPWVLIEAVVRSWDAAWSQSVALPVTLALLATTLFLGAAQWKGALAGLGAAWGTMLAGLAAVTGLSVALVAFVAGLGTSNAYSALLTLHGPALTLGVAGVAALAHAAGRWLRATREDLTGGLVWGRDAWLVLTGALLALMAAQGSPPDESALPLALGALGLAVAVALHCAWRERTGRHVYFVQVAAVGLYALVRLLYARDLRPEHDALFALVLGFVLVGVTVLTRRAGIPPVARATRRFAALLPLGMALVLPSEATGEAALLAGGSSLLYAALGAVERSRLFGSLAAAACNAALLVAALSMDLEGIEVYLAPLGLLLLMLGQLFTSSLPQAARNAVRVVGGLLLYVPAAAKLTLRLGLAEDGTYAVLFGAVCLLGVMVGMALRIRAYLALGTLFLTLDVAATLVHAGLRDHRVGFGVMTLTGLAIVGGRVLATLHRQRVDLLWRRASVAIRGWD